MQPRRWVAGASIMLSAVLTVLVAMDRVSPGLLLAAAAAMVVGVAAATWGRL